MKRAIISGATGAIGTALIEQLIENNVEVLILCRGGSSRKNNIPSHELVKVKNCSMEELCGLQNNTGETYDVFFHFAWAGTTGSGRNDMFLQNLNVKYTLDAVDVAARFGCRKFIGAGSQAEYGRFEGLLRSDTPTFPETGYGIAKLCAGQMTRERAHQLGMQHNWTRVLSIYGPNDGNNSMVMSTVNKLLVGETPKFTKAEQQWDYLFSQDAAKAFYLIAEKGIDGKTYVIGSGKARQLKEYIQDIQDAVSPGVILEIGSLPYADKQVMYLCADIEELYKDTGWRPETDFRDGIVKTLNSIKIQKY